MWPCNGCGLGKRSWSGQFFFTSPLQYQIPSYSTDKCYQTYQPLAMNRTTLYQPKTNQKYHKNQYSNIVCAQVIHYSWSRRPQIMTEVQYEVQRWHTYKHSKDNARNRADQGIPAATEEVNKSQCDSTYHGIGAMWFTTSNNGRGCDVHTHISMSLLILKLTRQLI